MVELWEQHSACHSLTWPELRAVRGTDREPATLPRGAGSHSAGPAHLHGNRRLLPTVAGQDSHAPPIRVCPRLQYARERPLLPIPATSTAFHRCRPTQDHRTARAGRYRHGKSHASRPFTSPPVSHSSLSPAPVDRFLASSGHWDYCRSLSGTNRMENDITALAKQETPLNPSRLGLRRRLSDIMTTLKTHIQVSSPPTRTQKYRLVGSVIIS